MSTQAIVNLIVASLALGITVWKGPTLWGLISSVIAAACVAIGTLKIIPKAAADDLVTLGNALQQASPEKAAATRPMLKSGLAIKASILTSMWSLAAYALVLGACILLPLLGGTAFQSMPTLTACNATAGQIGQTFTDGLKAGACILAKVLSGVVDIPSLLTCANATEQLVIDVLNDFKAQRAQDAGLAAEVNTQQMQWVDQAIANATRSLAKKAPGK